MKLGLNGRFLAAPPGGVQRFALELAMRLPAEVDLTLFVPRGCAPPPVLDGAARVVSGATRGPLWEQLELPARARRSGVDVMLHPANAAPRWGGPNVVVLHDLAPMSQPEAFTPAYRAWSRWAHAGAAVRAAGVVTVSAWSAREIARLLGIDEARISVARQGVAPLDRPATADAVAAVRMRHGLAHRYFVATTGGDPRKGEDFLRALWRAWPRRPSWSWSAPTRRTCTPPARVRSRNACAPLATCPTGSCGRCSRVRWPFSTPSRFEGFGRPPLEALACGTRVVAAPYGPASELLGDACSLLSPDVAAWRSHLATLLTEGCSERAAGIAEGRRLASTFRWQDAVAAVLRACHRAAGGGE